MSADEPYENTLSVDELRHEVRQCWDRVHALTMALKNAPEVPPVCVLHLLSDSGKFPEDWKLGKALQRQHGFDVVPLKTEYEIAAGLWSRIRKGLLADPALSAGKRDT